MSNPYIWPAIPCTCHACVCDGCIHCEPKCLPSAGPENVLDPWEGQ